MLHQRARIAAAGVEAFGGDGLLWTVFAGRKVGHLARLAIRRKAHETGAAFAAETVFGDHAGEQRRLRVIVVDRIAGRRGVLQAAQDGRHQVDADEVQEAENAGRRNAERLADDGVRLLDVEV